MRQLSPARPHAVRHAPDGQAHSWDREATPPFNFQRPITQQEDRAMSGTTDEIKGRIEEAVGVVTDNQRLKDEGRIDQATGKVKKAVERVIDKAKE
jgi:uncharacterized protein YjbJ (UPF0337 family)